MTGTISGGLLSMMLLNKARYDVTQHVRMNNCICLLNCNYVVH